jgi:hypothetical protein
MATPAVREGPPTFYARWGDAPAFVLLALAAVGFARVRRRGAQPAGGTAA